jgi:hypothetical protein
MSTTTATAAPRSFGVFKPVGHVVISFPEAGQAMRAAQALAELGLRDDAVRHYSDREMLSQIDADIAHASPIAAVGQEMNLVLASSRPGREGLPLAGRPGGQ